MTHRRKVAELRKREERIAQRANYMQDSARRKDRRIEEALREKESLTAASEALKNDKRKKRPDDKRPGAEKFIWAFDFIPRSSPYDKRDRIPVDYRCRSFNEQRQYFDFLKEFIYPFNLPKNLVWAALEKETVKNERGKDLPSPDCEIIQLAKKWICDMSSGESFYKRNKEYFTKAEAHFFLVSDIPYQHPASVTEQFFYAKCLARRMEIKTSRVIAWTFSRKFAKDMNHPVVTGFLDFIARNNSFAGGDTGIEDICDFILAEIEKQKKSRNRRTPFSFGGRTEASVIALANEWHASIIREQEAQNALMAAGHNVVPIRERWRNPHNSKISDTPLVRRWSGISVSYSRFETEGCIWLFSQLHTLQDLLNEGRKMKNCVSSYSVKCASGDCAIFHVSCLNKDNQLIEDRATLEVNRNRALVQAKAKCNARISPTTTGVVRKWAQLNKVRLDIRV